MVVTILALVIGLMIAGAGVYYYLKERNDADSRKIYSIIGAVGAVIVIGAIVKIIVSGL